MDAIKLLEQADGVLAYIHPGRGGRVATARRFIQEAISGLNAQQPCQPERIEEGYHCTSCGASLICWHTDKKRYCEKCWIKMRDDEQPCQPSGELVKELYEIAKQHIVDGPVIKQAAARLDALEKACRWIPVSEGPPKNIADVWIVLDGRKSGQGFYGEDENGWGWEIYGNGLLTNVTHWKPIILPEQAALGETRKEMQMEQIIKQLESEMQCNCDLDNYEPTKRTGHSWVCRIHKAAIAKATLGEEVKDGT